MGVPEEILGSIRRHSMIEPGEGLVVALSGGGDSVALLRALHELIESGRLQAGLRAAHFNHRLRAEDSEGDESFCRELAGRLGVELLTGGGDVRSLAAGRGVGIEEAARDSRREFLVSAAASAGAGKIAFGHTLDDQAETVLFRALRGTGLAGLGGMRPLQEWRGSAGAAVLVRPMLGLRRDELRAWLRYIGQDWREDATNLDTAYSRNAVRLAVLPGAEKINPRAAEALSRLAALARRAADHLSAEAADGLSGSTDEDAHGGVSADVSALEALPAALREFALRRLVELATGSTEDLGYDSVERLADLVSGGTGRRVELPGGAVAERSYGTLTVSRAPPPSSGDWSVELPVPGAAGLPGGGSISAEVLPANASAGSAPGDASERLDFDAVGAPPILTVRSRREGDRLRPLGLGGTKKVKDLLIDEKVPMRERPRVPVVESAGGILWVAPYRVDEGAKVTASTERVLRLTFERGGRRPS